MTFIPTMAAHTLDAEHAYREYVAWALLFAIREAQMLLQTGASPACIRDVLRYVSDLSELAANDVQAGSNIGTIRTLVNRAEKVISLTFTQQPSP